MRTDVLPDLALLSARFLIAVLFLGGAAQKLLSPADARALLEMQDLPSALIWPALMFNGTAGLMLILGLRVRPIALLLAAYCGVTSIFHLIPEDPWQMSIFVKNWSIAGGCLALAVAGSGRFAWLPDKEIALARHESG